MKRVELVSLRLRNFAGARDATLDVDGASAAVFGRNASGKTTLFSAWTWLLFEKNSAGAKTFDIKTLDNQGRPLSGLEHEVEGVLRIDGDTVTLKRVYKEVWTKKRGSASAELTGNTVDHYWDGVPMSKSEYTDRIADIADETTWRLLSDPAAFQAMKWQERRAVLLEVCGDVADGDVIASNDDLADLPDILGKRSLEEHKKVLASRRPKLNEELRELPARIDEVQRSLPDVPDIKRKRAEEALETVRGERVSALERLAAARTGQGDASTERKRLREVEDALTALDREANRMVSEAADQATVRALAAKRALEDSEHNHKRLLEQAAELEADVANIEAELVQLRAEYKTVATQAIEAHVEDTCPTCNQALPADQVEDAHRKATADLNARKARQLAALTQRGEDLNKRKVAKNGEVALARSKAEGLERGKPDLEAALKSAVLEAAKPTVAKKADPTQGPEYAKLAAERDDLHRRIEALTAGDETAIAAIQAELEEIEARITSLEETLRDYDAIDRGQTRIRELQAKEKELAAEFERLEHELYLCEQFVRTKVELLEDKVAAKFRMVRFKLFDHQVNGGISEVCTSTVNGVPFESVNHAGQIAAGLDIIRTLQEHYGLSAPVFIDQAESIHDIPETGAQQIALVVSPSDKQLRVELQEEVEVAA